MHFFFCIGSVLHATGYNNEFTFIDPNRLIPELHIKVPFHYIKQLVFMIVVMPHKWSFELYQLYHLSIQFSCDPGTIVFSELREFFGKVYFIHKNLFYPIEILSAVSLAFLRKTSISALRSSCTNATPIRRWGLVVGFPKILTSVLISCNALSMPVTET